MSSSESEGEGLFSNLARNITNARNQYRTEKLLNTIVPSSDTYAGGKSDSEGKNSVYDTSNAIRIHLTEDDRIFDDIIAQNSKRLPPRSRKKNEINIAKTNVISETVDSQGFSIPTRGRGRKRGSARKGKVSDLNVSTVKHNFDNTIDSIPSDLSADDQTLEEIIAQNERSHRSRRKNKINNLYANTASDTVDSEDNVTFPARTQKRKRNGTRKNKANDTNNSRSSNPRGRGKRKSIPNYEPASSVFTQANEAVNNIGTTRRTRNSSRRSTGIPNSTFDGNTFNCLSPPISNARGRQSQRLQRSTTSRHQSGRSARVQVTPNQPTFPTYNIGNTDEYPDQLDDIQLFSKPASTKSDDAVNPDDNVEEDNNETLSVKVYWQNSRIVKFTLRKYQKLKEVFDSFAKTENVSINKLLFMYNDQILNCEDTPDSIGYNIAKFIDGGIVSNSVPSTLNRTTSADTAGITIKFQCHNTKKPLNIMIEKNDKILLAMTKCAEALEVPLCKLKFEFDGDSVAGTSTPEQMGLESGDCIDVIIFK